MSCDEEAEDEVLWERSSWELAEVLCDKGKPFSLCFSNPRPLLFAPGRLAATSGGALGLVPF